MALRFNAAEQALYDTAKQLSEAENRVIHAGGVIDAGMRHTHERIREALRESNSLRERMAVSIGNIEGRMAANRTADPFIRAFAQRMRDRMEALPEETIAPGNPDQAADDAPQERPAPQPAWYAPWRLNPDDIRVTGVSKYAETCIPDIGTRGFNPAGHRALLGSRKKFFMERMFEPFKSDEPAVPAVAVPAAPASPATPAARAAA